MRELVFAVLPTLLLLGGVLLGFVGEPENDPVLNASPLWGPGDPFYAVDPRRRMNLADPVLIWRGRPRYAGKWRYVEGDATNFYETNASGFRDDPVVRPKRAGTFRVVDVRRLRDVGAQPAQPRGDLFRPARAAARKAALRRRE